MRLIRNLSPMGTAYLWRLYLQDYTSLEVFAKAHGITTASAMRILRLGRINNKKRAVK